MMYWTEIRSRGFLRSFGLTLTIFFCTSFSLASTRLDPLFSQYLCTSILLPNLWPSWHLRKTKRHISQEISEWEEEVGNGDGHAVPPDAPELEWGFMEGDQQDETPAAPGHNAGEFWFYLNTSIVVSTCHYSPPFKPSKSAIPLSLVRFAAGQGHWGIRYGTCPGGKWGCETGDG